MHQPNKFHPRDLSGRLSGHVMSLLAMLLTACSISPRMETVPVQAIDLSGQWVLDRRESDDVRARLQPVFDKAESKWRKVERQLEERAARDLNSLDPPDEGGRSDNSTVHWLREQRQREALATIAFLSPATQLDIRQAAREVRFSSDKGEGSRVLKPGEESSLFVAMGGFVVTSGWQGASFIVNSRGSGENPVHVVERYTLLPITDGGVQSEERAEDRLEERVEVRLPLGKQAFRFVFKRAREQRR